MSLYNQDYLGQYVELAVRNGVALCPGQKLVITAPVDCAYFVRMAVECAYKAGAANVFVRWTDDACARTKYLLAPDAVFDEFPEWDKQMLNSLAREGAAFLSVSASDPEALRGVAPDRLSRFQKVASKALREYRDLSMSNHVQWSVVSIPTAAWARKVFPGEPDAGAAMALLWEKIFAACRVDGADPVENWRLHSRTLKERVETLNALRFTGLRLRSGSGTDLFIRLPSGHNWAGGAEKSRSGVSFLPNIPTEEIFTAPHREGAEGTVVASRPTVFRGDIIDGFSLTFQAGRVVSCAARQNQALLEKMLADVPGMDRLGEIALVPHDSPISRTGILFYNTLYDENASCHLALGRAYPDSLEGGADMDEKDLEEAGLNFSDDHHDFMFGDADLTVTGVMAGGETRLVMENGNFVI